MPKFNLHADLHCRVSFRPPQDPGARRVCAPGSVLVTQERLERSPEGQSHLKVVEVGEGHERGRQLIFNLSERGGISGIAT